MARNADKTVAALKRAFEKARRAEAKAIEVLPEKPTKAQADRCWALAAETNAAREALSKALDAPCGPDLLCIEGSHEAQCPSKESK